jgi:hypothetical protein
MHAPASVAVLWSKISIADAVPVTVALAVATRITLSPARGAERSAARLTVPRCAAAPSDDCGTLGITGDWPRELGVGLGEAGAGAGAGSVVSSHAEGVLSPDFAGSAGHEVSPFGSDD